MTINPFHYAMKSRHLATKKVDDVRQRNANILSDRIVNKPTEYNQIQNLKKSSFFNTVKDTLSMNRDKKYIAKNLDKTLNNLDKNQLNDFKNKI